MILITKNSVGTIWYLDLFVHLFGPVNTLSILITVFNIQVRVEITPHFVATMDSNLSCGLFYSNISSFNVIVPNVWNSNSLKCYYDISGFVIYLPRLLSGYYFNDCQLHLSYKHKEAAQAIDKINSCIVWGSEAQAHKLNLENAQFSMWPNRPWVTMVKLGTECLTIFHSVKILGLMLVKYLTFFDHVT